MLRIHYMQQWFSFSDRQMEDALYEIGSVCRFADFPRVTGALPDETTIFHFRHFLEDNGLTAVLLETINAHLKANGLLVSKGTMVDATIIHAPASTENWDKARDPDMHSTQKNGQWYFGMKIHIGTDSGAAHSVTGHTSDEYQRGTRHLGMRWCVNDYPQGTLETQTEQEPVVQAEKAQPQTIGGAGAGRAHNRIIKCQFGFRPPRMAEVRRRVWNPRRRKARYRGLAKNASQVNLLVGLANLYLLRRPLMAA